MVVFMDTDGACWTVPNPEVRMSFNWTMGRRKTDDPAPTEEPARIEARTPQRFRPTLAGQSGE